MFRDSVVRMCYLRGRGKPTSPFWRRKPGAKRTPAVETSAGLCKANFTQFLKDKSSRKLFQPLLVVIGYVTGYMY